MSNVVYDNSDEKGWRAAFIGEIIELLKNEECNDGRFENDDINATPLVTWRESANIVFGNWLNYCVYQDTPYNIDEIN